MIIQQKPKDKVTDKAQSLEVYTRYQFFFQAWQFKANSNYYVSQKFAFYAHPPHTTFLKQAFMLLTRLQGTLFHNP